MTNNPLEKDVEAKFRQMIERHKGLCLKWVCPGWAGVPDRICIFPGGRVAFAETKRPKGSRTARLQTYWADKLKSFGFTHSFVFTYEDVKEFERKIFGPETT